MFYGVKRMFGKGREGFSSYRGYGVNKHSLHAHREFGGEGRTLTTLTTLTEESFAMHERSNEMSTTTAVKTEKKWQREKIPNLISMSAPPCRMIGIEVYENEDGTHWVEWNPVVGFLCETSTGYSKNVVQGRYSAVGSNHKAMTDLGWSSDEVPTNDIFPIVAPRDELNLLEIWDGGFLDHCENRVRRTLEVCNWPPEQDRQNAIRIGRELLNYESAVRSAPLDEPTPTAKEPE